MAARDLSKSDHFRDKLERELKSGLVSLLLLLVVDRTGPVHGYRILQTIKESSGGRLAFKEGTAYPLLNNLERMELVASRWEAGAGGPPRKLYETTYVGRAALDQALEDWFGMIGSVERLLRKLDAHPGKARSHREDRR